MEHLPNQELASEYLDGLRRELLKDSYFAGVPSMHRSAGKTALCFHACKDPPEVRYHVLKLLPRLKARVQVDIRRKIDVAYEARSLLRRFGARVRPNAVYDDLVKRLFKGLLHKADQNQIIFARRGKTDRYVALHQAIERAKANFERTYRRPSDRSTLIRSASPHEFIGLQGVDYYLWALQRLYERGEARFFNMLAPQYRLIMDLDDKSNHEYGEWYSDNNPLQAERMKPVAN